MAFLKKHLLIAASALFALGNTTSYAQNAPQQEKKKELVSDMLREKLHSHTERILDNIIKSNAAPEEKTTTGYDQRISSNGSTIDEAEVSIAVNPNDSNFLVLSYMQQTSAGSLTFPIYYSSNGGSTWARSSFSSLSILNSDFPGHTEIGGGDPAFAWDKNGKLYFAWIYLSLNTTNDTAFFTLNWAYSNDSGRTWSTTAKHFIGRGAIDAATGNTLPFMDGITDREWLAVDNSGGAYQGHVYCSFVCFPAGTASAYEGIKALVPGIDTFGNAVPAHMGNTQFGNVEVDKGGVLHMSFADFDNNQIRHVASTDGGASFGTSTVISGATEMFPPGPSYVFHNRENAAINMAVDGSTGTGSNVHVVWSDFLGSTVISCYSHSTDNGNTWSLPDTLNKHFGGQQTLMPTVAVAGNNVAISVTAGNTPDTASYYQLGSTDNGVTFGNPALTSSAPTDYIAIGANSNTSRLFFGDYSRSVRNTCQVYASWSDGRVNTAKVYFARKNFCTLGVQEITSVGDDIQLVSIFPNPASGAVNLQIHAGSSQQATVELFDMSGKKITGQNINLKSGSQQINIPLQGIAKGAYLLSLQNEKGIIATRTVVVQ